MVYLSRIYTKSGDEGLTSLGDGVRVAKTHPRIAAYGTVDELNAVVGVALAAGMPAPYAAWLEAMQHDLFDLGADLCVPEPPPVEPGSAAPPRLQIIESQVTQLERWIDEITNRLAPLTSFILPGGSLAAAHLHHARTVCRRAERDVWELAAREPVNRQALLYLNRLSDLLFVLSRAVNRDGADDVLWIPGKNRASSTPS